MSKLQLSLDEMRAAGHQAVDLIAALTDGIRDVPAHVSATRAQLQGRWDAIPDEGRPVEEVIAQAHSEILGSLARPPHPRFLAFIPSPGNYVGVLADFLGKGHNVFAGSWYEASGPAMIEVLMIDWLRTLAGLPPSAGGAFVSGGSMANLTALAAARDAMLGEDGLSKGVVYLSDQTHSSIDRALRLLGFTRRQIRKIPSDDAFRLPVDALRAAMKEDRDNARLPFCVVANAGTTNTGAVDPLVDIASLCRREGMWLHVDGAYGAAAALCDEGRKALAGLDQVDSLSFDPHKWLFQPIDCGCALVRDSSRLLDAFHMAPEYLKDVGFEHNQPNFWDYSPELTRPFRALQLWMTLQVFGVNAVRTAIENGLALARFAEEKVRAMPDWEIVNPAQLAIVAFRYAPAGWSEERISAFNRDICKRLTDSGFAFVLSTVLKGKSALRFCTINPRTTEDDIVATLAELNAIAAKALNTI